jgi:hypothetical protein
MVTPTFDVLSLTAEKIVKNLEKEFRRQQKTISEPIFRKQNVDQSYDYLCEIKRNRFILDEIDNSRMRITEPNY